MLDRLAIFLEREGGYHLLSLGLILAGAVMIDATARVQVGRDLVVFGLGVLARSMGQRKGETNG